MFFFCFPIKIKFCLHSFRYKTEAVVGFLKLLIVFEKNKDVSGFIIILLVMEIIYFLNYLRENEIL